MRSYNGSQGRSRIFDLILDRAGEPKKRLSDGSWLVRCPAHADNNPSLHVTLRGDRVLLHCFVGCRYEDILQGFGITDTVSQAVGSVEDIYVYHDEDGKPLYRKVRYFPKDFLVERYVAADTWEPGLGTTRRVIFNLPAVLKASKVYIVEGEKDAKTLNALGLVATTNPSGASEKIVDDYIKPMAGKEVVIIPDMDGPGLKHGLEWAQKLHGTAKTVKLVRLPDAKDVTEFLSRHQLEDLLRLENETSEFTGPGGSLEIKTKYWTVQIREPMSNVAVVAKGTKFLKNGHISTNLSVFKAGVKLPVDGIYYVSSMKTRAELAVKLEAEAPLGYWEGILARLHEELVKLRSSNQALEINSHDHPLELKWIIEPFVLESVPNILYGLPSSMKSLMAMAIGASVVTGKPAIPGTILHKTGPVLILDWESAFEVCAARWRKLPYVDHEVVLYRECNLPLVDELDAIGEIIEERKPVLVIVDSLGPAAGGDLNNPETAITFYYGLKQLEVPSLTIAHAPKNQPTSIYGSVFFSAIPKNIWTIKRLDASPDESEFKIAATQEKFTTGFLRDPIGLTVRFSKDDAKVQFEKFDLGDLYPDLFTNLPLGKRILMVVRRGDGVTRDEIADILGVSREAVRKELYRLRHQELIEESKGKIYPTTVVPF